MENAVIPSITILVPNYNHSSYLEQRIESILDQTFQDFEIILMDDCSTDSSINVLEKFRANPKVSRIELNQYNSGSPFGMWEKGFRLAKGKYIWIAESDDWADVFFFRESMELHKKD